MKTYLTPPRLFALSVVLLSLLLAACGGAAAEKKKGKKSKKSNEAEVAKVEEENDEHSDTEPDEEKHEDPKTEKEPAKAADPHKEKAEPVSLEPIWNELMKGNKLFMDGKYSVGNLLAERRELAKGQKPKVIVLGCADSRVPPEIVFGKNTGDLFVIRNAGNLADPIVLGSMEYAVEHLHSQVIVVLGHESCGAVGATVSGGKMPSRNLESIVNAISPALKDSKECPIGGKMNLGCVELNVKQTAKHLMTKSKILNEAVEKGHLAIVKAVYKMETGEVVKVE
jgi:carbonic anhydrase